MASRHTQKDNGDMPIRHIPVRIYNKFTNSVLLETRWNRYLSLLSKEILCRNMTNHIIIATDNDIFIITSLLFQHLTLCYLQTASNLFYHLFMFSA